jgi:hypothetical protein
MDEMARGYSWTCPYCNRDVTITNESLSVENHFFNMGNKAGELCLQTKVISCPNVDCRDFTVEATLGKLKWVGNAKEMGDPVLPAWKLKPKSSSKPFPEYIPRPILDDYYEACLIVDDSPKASATLSRRCLQGMIRNFWGVSKSRLIDEIEAIKGKIDTTTWEAIDAVRSIGNIGAHMEKDINLIVDVEPEESALLIGLVEFLLEDWYIARREREEHKKKVIALGVAKAAAKAAPTSVP